MGNKIEEIENKAKETSGGNYYYEQGFIYGFELGEENSRKTYLAEIENIRQKSISRRTTIKILNEKLKCRLEQVERLKQENKKLWGENAELKKYKKICDNCKEDVVVQYRKLFNENEQLEKENAELKYNLKCRDDELAESKAQVEKMKCKNKYVVSDKNSNAVPFYTVRECKCCKYSESVE